MDAGRSHRFPRVTFDGPVNHGRAILLFCEGTGRPAVVMESGYRDNGALWSEADPVPPAVGPAAMPGLASINRVCSYDRSGTLDYSKNPPTIRTRSSPVPMPHMAAAVASDLHATLAAAHVPGPYVLVGHWGPKTRSNDWSVSWRLARLITWPRQAYPDVPSSRDWTQQAWPRGSLPGQPKTSRSTCRPWSQSTCRPWSHIASLLRPNRKYWLFPHPARTLLAQSVGSQSQCRYRNGGAHVSPRCSPHCTGYASYDGGHGLKFCTRVFALELSGRRCCSADRLDLECVSQPRHHRRTGHLHGYVERRPRLSHAARGIDLGGRLHLV
jgi:hypothetical protein